MTSPIAESSRKLIEKSSRRKRMYYMNKVKFISRHKARQHQEAIKANGG